MGKHIPAAAGSTARLKSAPSGAVLGAWTEQALCTKADPEVFFPPKGDAGKQAKQICAQCPVGTECLDYAIAADEKHGIWGGLNRTERQRAGKITLASPRVREDSA
jgi:WhiB family transcriptional regulator, redox-sensing transcriptional regulator